MDIPLLLLIPLVFIAILIVIFIVMIIRDRLAERTLIGALNLGDEAKEAIEEPYKKKPDYSPAYPDYPKETEVSGEGKKKEMEKPEKKPGEERPKEGGTDYYPKVVDLEERLSQINLSPINVRAAYEELIKLVRGFFSEHLNINYAFTYGELNRELKEKQEKILISPEALSKIEYGPHPVTQSELINMIDEFKNIIIKSRIEGESWSNADNKGNKEADTIGDNTAKIKEFLAMGNKTPKKDLNSAISIYRQIYPLYYGLPKKERKRVYADVIRFYSRIKSEKGASVPKFH